MRIGLLGFGSMGKVHTYAVKNLSLFHSPLDFDAEIVGVCCSTPESTARAAKAIGKGVKCYASPEELLSDPDIDAVDICTPNPSHYPLLLRAIEAGKHILCEKPLCVTYEEAARVARLAEEKGISAQVVFHNRFHAPVLRAKQLLDEGRLGRILSFRFRYLHDSCVDPEKPAGWKQTAQYGGGVLNDLGSHVLDLVMHLLGGVASVSARSQIAFPVRRGMDGEEWKTDADEASYLTLTLLSGAVGTVEVSKLTTGANDDLGFEISGEKGALRFSLMSPAWLEFYDRTAPASPIGGERGFTKIECVGRFPAPAGVFPSVKAPVGWLRAHEENMFAFLSAASGGRKCDPSFWQGAQVQKVIEAARRSDAEEGREVRVSPPLRVLGLTGGSGSGKGYVSSLLLKRFGIRSVDCDAVARKVLSKGQPCLNELAEAFGKAILTEDGEYDRVRMASIVFSDPEKLALLNRISHRHILSAVREEIAQAEKAGERALVVDAPQLFESGFDKECDAVIAVLADEGTRIARILSRDGITEERAKARIASQLSDDFFLSHADHFVYNPKNCTRETLETQLTRILHREGIEG